MGFHFFLLEFHKILSFLFIYKSQVASTFHSIDYNSNVTYFLIDSNDLTTASIFLSDIENFLALVFIDYKYFFYNVNVNTIV